MMWFKLIAHLLVTLARVSTPGGVRAVTAESLAVKHQLLIMKRSQPQRRSPKMTAWDRLILGCCTLLVSPRRLGKMAVILKTSTLFRLHRALVKRKISLALEPRATPAPGAERPVEGTDRRGGRDETAQPILRLSQDRRANF